MSILSYWGVELYVDKILFAGWFSFWYLNWLIAENWHTDVYTFSWKQDAMKLVRRVWNQVTTKTYACTRSQHLITDWNVSARVTCVTGGTLNQELCILIHPMVTHLLIINWVSWSSSFNHCTGVYWAAQVHQGLIVGVWAGLGWDFAIVM